MQKWSCCWDDVTFLWYTLKSWPLRQHERDVDLAKPGSAIKVLAIQLGDPAQPFLVQWASNSVHTARALEDPCRLLKTGRSNSLSLPCEVADLVKDLSWFSQPVVGCRALWTSRSRVFTFACDGSQKATKACQEKFIGILRWLDNPCWMNL